MLEVTRTKQFLPGVNVKGQVAGANWMFLRPSIDAGHVVCVGVPPLTSVATLARFSRKVMVIVPPWRPMPAATTYAQWPNVTALQFRRATALPCEALTVDTLCVVDTRAHWWLQINRPLLAEVRRVLKAEAICYSERYQFAPPAAVSQSVAFTLSPLRGELHVAVPAAGMTNATFGRLAAEARTLDTFRVGRIARRIASRVSAAAPFMNRLPAAPPLEIPGPRLTRVATLSGSAMRNDQPPAYLRSIAAQSGVDIAGFSWAFLASGDYASRKLLFFLTDPRDDRRPAYIAKMVRDPMFNGRLENEYRVLQWLHTTGGIEPCTAPRPVFHGQHAGLTVVGEAFADGVPMMQRSNATENCPYFQRMLAWLDDLGAIARAPGSATPMDLDEVMGQLLTQYEALFAPPRLEREFLRAQVERLSSLAHGLPLVIQHGDPGSWNVMARPDGGVTVLDWEAAELDGMPLWDTFYFFCTFALAAHRRQGGRSAVHAVRRYVLPATKFSAAGALAVERYCERVGVPGAAVEPLFYLCWVHRALKEATRLPAGQLDRSRFAALLQELIRSRNAPGLQRLLLR